MMTASVAVEEALLLLKAGFIVLLYLFIWRIVRSASRDLRLPQESFVLAPQQVARTRPPAVKSGRLVVVGRAGGRRREARSIRPVSRWGAAPRTTFTFPTTN